MESDGAICDNSGKSRETLRVRYLNRVSEDAALFLAYFERGVAHFDCSSGILFTLGS